MHFLKIPVFLGWILRILWSKVTNNYGVSKICVFLHPEMFEFHVVGELSCWGHNWNRCAKSHSLLLLERCKIRVKIYIFWAILRCVIDALSNSAHAGGEGQKAHLQL